MIDKFIYYDYDGKNLKVPVEQQKEFEEKVPSAKMMVTYNGKNYKVPLEEMETFTNKVGLDNITYSSFDDERQYNPELSTVAFGSYSNPSFETPQLDESEIVSEYTDEDLEQYNAYNELLNKQEKLKSDWVAEKNPDKKNILRDELTAVADSVRSGAEAYESNPYTISQKETEATVDDLRSEINKWKDEDVDMNAAMYQSSANEFDMLSEGSGGMWHAMSSLTGKLPDKNPMVELQKLQQYTSALQFLDRAERLRKEYQSVGHGIKNWFETKMEEWGNQSDTEAYLELHSVMKRLEDKFGRIDKVSAEDIESALTQPEKALLLGYFEYAAAMDEMSGKQSSAYKGGEIIGNMVDFGIEMALTGGFSKLAGKTVSKGLSKGLTAWIQSSGKGTLAREAKRYTSKALKGVTKTAVAAVPSTMLSPSAYKNVAKSTVRIGEDGKLMDSAGDIASSAFGEYIERFTELSGEGMADLIGGSLAKIANSKGGKWLLDLPGISLVSKSGKWFWNSDARKAMGVMGVQSMPIEMLEEVEGAALNEMFGLDSKALDQFFEEDNIMSTLIGFAPTTALGAGISSVSLSRRYSKMSSSEKNLYNVLKKQTSDESTGNSSKEVLDNAIAAIKSSGNPNEMAASMRPLFDIAKTNEERKAVLDFAKSVAAYKSKLADKSEQWKYDEIRELTDKASANRTFGQMLTWKDIYDVNEAEAEAINNAKESGEHVTDDVAEMSSFELLALIEDGSSNFSLSEKEALKSVVLAKSIHEGLRNKLEESTTSAIEKSKTIIDGAAKNGELILASLNGKMVYVTGDATVSNGAIQKPDGATKYLVEVVDITTGEKSAVNSDELKRVGKVNAETYSNLVSRGAMTSFEQDWEKWKNTKSLGSKVDEISQYVGQKIYINTNGKMAEVEVSQILPDGVVLIKGKKGDLGGQSAVQIGAAEFYDSIARDAEGNVIKGSESREGGISQSSSEVDATQTSTEPVDYRKNPVKILINDVPVEVDVMSQDNTSDTIVYSYEENGQTKIGSSTIQEFADAVQDAEKYTPETTVVPEEGTAQAEPAENNGPVAEGITEAVVEEPVEAPAEDLAEPAVPVTVPAESINWDELFERDKEAFFVELQKQYGEKTERFLDRFIAAAENELAKREKSKPESISDIIENEEKIDALQEKIASLKDMLSRLTAPAVEQTQTEAPVVEETQTEQPVVSEQPVAQTQEDVVAEPVSETVEVTEEEDGINPNAAETVLPNGYIEKDKRIINPTPIELPNSPEDASRIFLAEKDGKWGYQTYVKFDNETSYGSPNGPIQTDASHLWFDTKEEAIKAALKYFDYIRNHHGTYKGKPHGTNGIDAFVQYVKDNYLNKPAESTAKAEAPAHAEAAKPVASDSFAKRLKKIEDLEKELEKHLNKSLEAGQPEDLAKAYGRRIGNLFATREEYDAYLPTAKDFGKYNDYVEAGIEESLSKKESNSFHIGNILHKATEAWKLATDAAIKLLEKAGLKPIKVSNKQAAEMLRIMEEVSQTPVEKMTVFHGSPHQFEQFDHSKMGTGEGAQAHGWGTYVARDRQTGVEYADVLRHTPKILRNGLDVTSNVRVGLKWANTPLEVVATAIDWYGIDGAIEQIKEEIKKAEDNLANRSIIFSDQYQEKIELYKNALVIISSGSWELQQSPARLYTVEIPEDNGSNYFYEDGVTDDQMEKLSDACEKEGVDFIEVAVVASEMGERKDGDRLYKALSEILGSPKAASEFLSKAGFVGIKYNGRIDGECYVIFNEADAKITGHTELYQTPDGTVYGWTDGKNIYLTEAGINPNTPIHEYTHLWARAMMKQNPKGWNSIKNLLKGTDIWDEVVNDPNYSAIKNDEDAVASEALSRVSGSNNAAKLEAMAQKMIDEAKGNMQKVKARGLIQNIKDALKQFWSWVGKHFFEIENFNSIDEVTDRVLYDLVNQTDLGELSAAQVETQIVTDPKVIAELEAAPKRQGFRNVVMNEDGSFSSPMAYWLQSTKEGAKSRVETAKFELGKWEEAEEHPELVDENGKVTLVKPNKTTVAGVAYDPYIHNRLEPVNLQFKDAWKRDDLVYVETEVPETDLESGYHADKALLPVGVHSWSNGDVMLSKYDKPVRILPWEEVADAWAARLNGRGVEFDVVPPALRQPLVERGVEILPPHKGMGKDCNDAYNEWKKENPQSVSRDLTSSQSPKVELNQTAERAQTKDGAKIAKSIEGLRELANSSKEIKESRPKVLVDYLANALKLDPSQRRKKSKRNKYTLPNGETISVRASDHNADSNTYIEFNFNQNYNLAITFKSKHSKNSFKANENVRLDEYVYFVEDIKQYDGSVLSEIAASLADFLETGVYTDTTGLTVDTVNTSPKGAEPRTKENYTPEILSRKVDAQNAAVDYLAGDARSEVIENAVNEEATKLGVKVTYKTREQMEKGHENYKGYYDTRTGEIVICTENNANVADAIQTILHEAVAHKGLRALMGDKFNQFINRVYNSLDAKTKAEVDALAAKEYDGNTAVAMEEYMAKLAESEKFSEQSIWEKIKTIFNNIINSLLGRNDVKIGDNELRYLLGASYNNMVNPNGMKTLEGWAKDLLMRENYGIDETNTATPDILSRTGIDVTEVAKETASQVYDKAVNSTWNEFQREFQDAYQPVRVALEAIQKETGNIPVDDYENFLLMQNQTSSRSRVEIDNFARNQFSPIVEQINKIIDEILESRGIKKTKKKQRAEVYKEVLNYLIAKHGLERNKYYQEHKTRSLNPSEKKAAQDTAKAEYDAEVESINAETSLTDAERELKLRDAQDAYNAALEEIKTRQVADMRDYSGLTSLFGLEAKEYSKAEKMAREAVEKFEAQFNTENLWKKINAATNKTLRHSYESGLLSRKQYEEIKSMFKFYIPLRGFDETTAEDIYSYSRFDGNRFNPAVKTAKGRTSVAFDPIATIMNMAESEIAQGNKNRAKQALYYFIMNRPVTDENGNQTQNSLMQVEDVWYVVSKDSEGNETYQIAVPDHAHGETYEAFENRMLALSENGEAFKSQKGKVDVGVRFQKQTNKNAHYVYLKINGVEKAIFFNGDPKAADAINGTFMPKDSKAVEKFKNVNRKLSSMFTNYSLEFTMRNYFRDMIYSRINIGMREKDPAYRKKFRQNWRRNNLGTMIKMLKAYKNGQFDGAALTKDQAAFVEFMDNGGQTGYTLINSVERHKKDLENAIENIYKGIEKGGVKDSKIFSYTLGSIEFLNEASELVTRFAAFKTSRDMGRSIVQSVADAKEVTVNFNTKGAQDNQGFFGVAARFFGWSKYFFNASVQGVQNIKAMADANRLKFCTTVGSIAALGFLMPILTATLVQMLGGDDDDRYWNIPEYERQNNICIVVGDTYIKIPLPVGFREIYAMGDMTAALMFDKKFDRDFAQVGTDYANKIASVILPINPLESAGNGLSLWHTAAYTLAPSSTQFIVQNMTNTDWKGAPLQREYTWNENDPSWMKAFDSNPDWMTGLSKWCYENIGGISGYGGLDFSPENLDNTLSNMFGGVYSLVKKTGEAVSAAWNGEEMHASSIPVVGVLAGRDISSSDSFVNDAYYEMKEFYDKNLNYIKRTAEAFGYTLDDIFINHEGAYQPKINEIYSNDDYEWMEAWYLGSSELEDKKKEVEKLEKTLKSYGELGESQLNEIEAAMNEYNLERKEFVEDMLEFD